ncbi:hypothetical protein ACKWTF_016599 [Chironomus riparius]
MYKKLTVIVTIIFVIDIVAGTPVKEEEVTTKQTLKKRDVSSLKLQRNNDESVYGNNTPGHEAQTLNYVYKKARNDNYYFAYKQSDLQEREETGIYEYDAEQNKRKLKVTGFYEYIRPDGIKQRVEYTSDDMGFHPNVIES